MNIILTDNIMENHISLNNMRAVLKNTPIINIDKANLDIKNGTVTYNGQVIYREIVKKVWIRVNTYSAKLYSYMQFFNFSHIMNPTIEVMNDKLASAILAANNNIDIIPTYQLSIYNVSEFNSFPYIVKTVDGYAGEEVFKVYSEKELKDLIFRYCNRDLIVQPFIKEGSTDYRVIIGSSGILQVIKRSSVTSDFRANTSQGGKKEIIEDYDNELRDIALETFSAFNADLVALDFVKTKSGYLFCEANNSFRIGDLNLATKIKYDIEFD